MAYSRIRYDVDAAIVLTPTVSYTGPLYLPAGAAPLAQQFDVYLNTELLTITTDYTVNTTNGTVTIIRPLTIGDTIAIQRDTKKDQLYVDFTNNAIVDEADLDLDFNQIFFIAQEAFDLAEATIRKVPAETHWDGKNLPSINCAPATNGSGWVTYNQALDILSGAVTASADGCQTWCWIGDGLADTRYLNDLPCPVDSCMLFVTIDGVTISPLCAALSGGVSSGDGDGTPYVEDIDGVIIDTFPTPTTCIDKTPDTVANIITAINAAITAIDGRYVRTLCDYGVAAETEHRGSLEQALAFFTSGLGAPGPNGYFLFCPSGILPERQWYTVDCITREITFNIPPANDKLVQVRLITGTIRTALTDGSVYGAKLIDHTVDPAKLGAGAGSDARVLRFDANGYGYAGLLYAGNIADFASAVRGISFSTLTAASSNLNMNGWRVTGASAALGGSDLTTYAQVLTISNALAATEIYYRNIYLSRIAGGAQQTSHGIQPDLYFNNYSNSRVTDSAPYVGCPARLAIVNGTTADPLVSGFIPRRLTIRIFGDIVRQADDGGGVSTSSCDRIIPFHRWDNENGKTFSAGSNPNTFYWQVYPKNPDTGADSEIPNTDCFIECEFVAPYRTWLRFHKRTDYSKLRILTKVADAANPGTIQVIAEKGL